MTISELSEKTGVSPRMLRYFEQQELLIPDREDNHYRVYSEEHQKLVLQICDWQRMGLTLKEIKGLQESPDNVEEIISQVFQRERQNFLIKQKSLQDLRERLTGKKDPYFEQRVAYQVPGLDEVLQNLEQQGVKCHSVEYVRHSEVNDFGSHLMVGEMIHQSAFYLLSSAQPFQKDDIKRHMADFCKVAQKQWGVFDGHPPQDIEPEDLNLFFAPGDILMRVRLGSSDSQWSLILPYQSIYAMAKALERSSAGS